ncbi:MAG: HEAT repeat domain-containing protein [Planctomycetaceae bacterium]
MPRRLLVTLGLAASLAAPAVAWTQDAAEAPGVLAREPQTPVETFDAALTMLKLSRPELAHQYLVNLLASNPDDATLLEIRSKHGTATFIQLSRLEAIQPESATLLEMLNAAARNQLADPNFRDSLLSGLTGSPRQRESAMDTLRALDDDGPPLLIGRLAVGAPPELEVSIMETLLRFGSSAIAPLEAALDSSNDHMRTLAAELLGRLGAKSSVLRLSVAAFDPQSPPVLRDAALKSLARIEYGDPARAGQVTGLRLSERLRNAAAKSLAMQSDIAVEDSGQTPIWFWSEGTKTVERSLVSPSSALQYRGERLARSAVQLSLEDRQAQTLLLAQLMWRDVLQAGWDQPILSGPGTAHDLALTLSPDLSADVLKLADESHNPAAALVALAVLGQTGSRSQLLSASSPVLAELNSSEPRLQFAAAETVMQLDPQQSFPGAARVVEIFARALQSSNLPKTVVVDPNTRRANSLAGLMSAMGFESNIAPTGREGFTLAAEEGNVELAVLHLNTVQWELTQTIANLRADPRTKRIPIAVYGPSALRSETSLKLKPYQLVGYVDDAGDPSLLREQLSPLIQSRQVPELTDQQRSQQRQAAAFWLRHMADGQRQAIFPLGAAEQALSSSAGDAGVGHDSLLALAAIGKPSVQQRIADVALSTGTDASTRLTAIVHLAFHIQRFGRMLNAATAQNVSDAYRAEQDPSLQSAWAAVIGALGPNTQGTAGQLLAYPPAAAPLP